MTDLPEKLQYPSGIYQIETTDPVLGGPPNLATKAGLSNIQALQLADRTKFLKETTALSSRAVKAGDGLIGGGDLTNDRTLNVDFATLGQAWSGESETKSINPSVLADVMGRSRGIPNQNIDEITSSGLFFGYCGLHVFASAGDNPFPDLASLFVVTCIKVPIGDADEYITQTAQIVNSSKTVLRTRSKPGALAGWSDWFDILVDRSAVPSSYLVSDAPNTWLSGENFKGDTSVTLGNVNGRCYRVGNVAQIVLAVDFGGFSVVADDDGMITGTLDLQAIAQDAGWFSNITDAHIGVAYARLFGTNWDAPWVSFYCSIISSTNSLFFNTFDTSNVGLQSSNATDVQMKFMFTIIVED